MSYDIIFDPSNKTYDALVRKGTVQMVRGTKSRPSPAAGRKRKKVKDDFFEDDDDEAVFMMASDEENNNKAGTTGEYEGEGEDDELENETAEQKRLRLGKL